jgi:hypothetical protein
MTDYVRRRSGGIKSWRACPPLLSITREKRCASKQAQQAFGWLVNQSLFRSGCDERRRALGE